MPPINDYRCDKCGFSLQSGWGSYMYVKDETGKRVICRHPNEFDTVCRVLGAEAPRELIEQRTGFNGGLRDNPQISGGNSLKGPLVLHVF